MKSSILQSLVLLTIVSIVIPLPAVFANEIKIKNSNLPFKQELKIESPSASDKIPACDANFGNAYLNRNSFSVFNSTLENVLARNKSDDFRISVVDTPVEKMEFKIERKTKQTFSSSGTGEQQYAELGRYSISKVGGKTITELKDVNGELFQIQISKSRKSRNGKFCNVTEFVSKNENVSFDCDELNSINNALGNNRIPITKKSRVKIGKFASIIGAVKESSNLSLILKALESVSPKKPVTQPNNAFSECYRFTNCVTTTFACGSAIAVYVKSWSWVIGSCGAAVLSGGGGGSTLAICLLTIGAKTAIGVAATAVCAEAKRVCSLPPCPKKKEGTSDEFEFESIGDS